MNEPDRERPGRLRQGIALGMVVLMGIVVLVMGLAMIQASSGLLSSSVDSKQRIIARMAALTQANLQMARAAQQASVLYGNELSLSGTDLSTLPTGDGTRGSSSVEAIGLVRGGAPREAITSGEFRGMSGLKVAYRIHTLGLSPGGGRSRLDSEIKLHQVPIFQFGVFYEGDLEINPGNQMYVGGPVHTNGNAYFRCGKNFNNNLEFKGPVSASGSIHQWRQPGGFWGLGSINYHLSPSDPTFYSPTLTGILTAMGPSSTPPAQSGISNVLWGVEKMVLPIGATPRSLLLPRETSDPVGLKNQKFDWRIPCGATCPPNRWVNEVDARPEWILGPRVFFDRREQAWVKYWDFDVSIMASRSTDSIFYVADLSAPVVDRGTLGKPVINAIRIVNGAVLPRNLTIATPNPVYLVDNFNLPSAGSSCGPSGVDPVPAAQRYCNAMIASDALTLLSRNWLSAAGTLDQPFSNATWATAAAPEPQVGAPGSTVSGTITVNAAILTGNLPSNPAAFPPSNTSDAGFEQKYEGGWHNTIRFLEDLRNATVNFNGSFVCLWRAQTPGLRTDNSTKKVLQTLNPSSAPYTSGYYLPPTRNWSFDSLRFTDLNNMPPATPFLTTKPSVSFAEVR